METLRISALRRAEYNPRTMPDFEMAALKNSLTTFGFVEPIVVNRRGDGALVLVGGHQRMQAVEELIAKGTPPRGIQSEDGDWLIPATIVELDVEQEKALNLALNKIRGRWDDKKLASIILEIKASPVIPATGFQDHEISRILDSTLGDDEEDETESDLLDNEREPDSKLGEVYELGEHRLICWDSTDPETYRKLLGKEKAEMVWTDPPYNVAYKSRGEKLNEDELGSIENDDLTPDQFKELIDRAFFEMFQHAKEGAAFYVCSGWSSYPQFLASMSQSGFRHAGVIIWVKNVPSMGWNDYRYKHEWIARATKPDKKTAEGIIYGWRQGTHQFYGDNEFDVWEMPRKAVTKYLHPTEKPDWLPMRAMRNSAKRGGIVLDPFAGSGSVMSAAEKTGRRAFMIELDPRFCDVIRKRWERIERSKQDKTRQ